MEIEALIRNLIRQEIGSDTGHHYKEPEWISISAAAEYCKCDRTVIDCLVKGSPSNGFPAAMLGPRTVWIDKTALIDWMREGGLLVHGKHN